MLWYEDFYHFVAALQMSCVAMLFFYVSVSA